MNSKDKILSKATKLIHNNGFNNTSIQDILDAASVTKSNFYYHFESKDQLGFEVLRRRIENFFAFVIGPSAGNPELRPRERIHAFLDTILAMAESPGGELGCPFGNLAQEMSTIHEPLRQLLSDFFSTCADGLEQVFEEGKRVGDFSEALPSRQLAEFMLAQIQGSLLLRKTHKDVRIMESNIEMLRRLINGWLS